MSREDEVAAVRDQVSILAEQVARLLDVIAIRSDRGWNVRSYEEKLVLLETLMWKLHRRQTRLKAQASAINSGHGISPA
jgi:hypothetical protein